MVVDPYDEAFYKPSKVIGRVMSEEEAAEERKKGNHVVKVDGGQGLVSLRHQSQWTLLNSRCHQGTLRCRTDCHCLWRRRYPVLQQGPSSEGCKCSYRKDTIAGHLADQLDADMLVILTGVDKVCLRFGTEQEKPLDYMSIKDAVSYMAAGEFEEGTMLPKIQAAVDYIGDSAIRKVLITKLSAEDASIGGKNGTMIGK